MLRLTWGMIKMKLYGFEEARRDARRPKENLVGPQYLSVKQGLVISLMGVLACFGGCRMISDFAGTMDRVANGRPTSEVFYDCAEDVSYTSKLGVVDNATGKSYTVTQETERNHWDNLDYQVRTGRLVLGEG